jgi:serine beta-lactamase-like protein LACTB, mitochondrial
MASHTPRFKKRVAIAVLAIGLVLSAVMAILPMFVSALAIPLHEEPERVPSAADAKPPAQWADAVGRSRQIVRNALVEQNLPGLSVAVGAGGDVVWAEGFGWSNIKDHVPVTPKTRFRIASTSEALTSAAIGALLEQSRLNLDDEIQQYVPEFPKKRWPLTLRQVMAHVGGLPADDELTLNRQRCERPAEALPVFADRDLLFEPGTEYRYSHYDWILASLAIEAASGQPFLTFMRDRIFAPAGMIDTGAESAKEENPDAHGEDAEDAPPLVAFHDLVLEPIGLGHRPKEPTEWATAYVRGWGPKAAFRHGVHVKFPRNLSCYAGALSFFSTPSDLVRFGLGIDSGKLLQPATLQQLQASQPSRPGQDAGRGLGWDRETVTLAGARTEAIGHDTGPATGTRLSFRTFGERGLVVAVMSNIAHADTATLARKIAEEFGGGRRKEVGGRRKEVGGRRTEVRCSICASLSPLPSYVPSAASRSGRSSRPPLPYRRIPRAMTWSPSSGTPSSRREAARERCQTAQS